MRAFITRYPLVIALGALALVLAIVVAWESAHDAALEARIGGTPVRRTAPFEAKLLPSPPIVQAEQQYPEFAARPLWTPTRRPAPAALPPSTYTPGQYQLLGVIIAGSMKTAMLREKANGRLHRVESGRQLNGITVAEIAPESVTLTQGADREVVQLQVQRGAAATGAPGAPPPQADFGPARPVPQPAPPVPSAPAASQAAAPNAGFFGGPAQPGAAPPGTTPAAPPPANPLAPPQAVPTPSAATGAMTAEELLARRRARRSQQTQ